MNAKVILFLSCLVIFAQAQTGREVKLIIDPFEPETPILIIQVFANTTFPAERDAFTRNAEILGGERDLHLEATRGQLNSIFSSAVSAGEWTVSTPSSAAGFAYMQYDGTDGSPDLDTNGLGGVDFLVNGADAFVIEIRSDLNTFYDFRVTDMDGDSSEAELPILQGNQFQRFELPFSEFNGVIDFRRVGSVEILIDANNAVDTTIRLVGIIGPIISPSPSPSRSPTPSPVVNPSGTPSPSPTPSPSTIPEGPRFTWYTFDDDDNGREPCDDERPRPDYFFNDDNILYYYFYGTFDDLTLSTTSGAPIIATSVLLAGVIALLV